MEHYFIFEIIGKKKKYLNKLIDPGIQVWYVSTLGRLWCKSVIFRPGMFSRWHLEDVVVISQEVIDMCTFYKEVLSYSYFLPSVLVVSGSIEGNI